MGPGRLTGMNDPPVIVVAGAMVGFNGARSIDRDERLAWGFAPGGVMRASMGPGRLTGMNAQLVTECHNTG